MSSIRRFIKRNNLELQFWGYEGGNVLATVAGAGGFHAFSDTVDGVVTDSRTTVLQKLGALAVEYPDAFVTMGLGSVVVLAPALRRTVARACGEPAVNLIDVGTAVVAVAILLYALSHETSWITVSASSFVVGSSLLRQCRHNPFLLKAGGLALALGGAALAAFGIEALLQALSDSRAMQVTFAALTAGTGLYVTGASLLTYQGGIHETAACRPNASTGHLPTRWIAILVHPTNGMLARLFARTLDAPISWAVQHVVNPAVFWASRDTKSRKPFATSMWARLPWRIATGSAAIATATPQGLAFGLANLGWAIGDLSIGSLDWVEEPVGHRARSPAR